jgi:hypothetical protein
MYTCGGEIFTEYVIWYFATYKPTYTVFSATCYRRLLQSEPNIPLSALKYSKSTVRPFW